MEPLALFDTGGKSKKNNKNTHTKKQKKQKKKKKKNVRQKVIEQKSGSATEGNARSVDSCVSLSQLRGRAARKGRRVEARRERGDFGSRERELRGGRQGGNLTLLLGG